MRQMSNNEYAFMVGELSGLKGSRLEKIYELAPLRFRLRFHQKGMEAVDVVCEPPIRLHATRLIEPAPSTPSAFCMFLRKRLRGAVVEGIEQHDLDRIVVFRLKAGGESYALVFELFGDGNVVLVDDKGLIEGVWRSEEWRERKLRKGEQYVFPPSPRLNPFELTPALLSQLTSEKPIITVLAASVNLGAIYLEDALLKAGISPKKSASELSEGDWANICNNLRALSTNLSPFVFYKDGKPADYALVRLAKYAELEARPFPSFSAALDAFYQPQAAGPPPEVVAARAKLERQLAEQLAAAAELEAKAAEAKAAAEWIHAHFTEVEELLELARERKKKKKEFEAKLAALHATFNEKEGKITLDA
ncbi:MAG: NFACT family protein [Candidatus Micrarchaeia archaeon]